MGVILAGILACRATPSAAQEAPALEYRSVRIQQGEGFGLPSAMGVGPDGKLHVAYPGPPVIRVWTPEDRRWVDVPLGEVGIDRFPARLGWQGQTLWLTDSSMSRLVLLASDGRVVRSLPLFVPRPRIGASGFRILAVLPGDLLLVETSAPVMGMALADPRYAHVPESVPPSLSLTAPVASLPVWVTRPEGVVVDTITSLPTRNRALLLQAATRGDSTGTTTVRMKQGGQPFADHPLITVDPAGTRLLVVDRTLPADADPPSFTVRVLSTAGDTLRVLRFGYDPVPLRDEWMDEQVRRFSDDLSDDPAEALRIAREAIYRPRWLPPVSGVRTGPSGWIWLRREDVPGATAATWEIVDPGGRRVGAIDLEADLDVMAVDGPTAWARVRADEGYEIWQIDVQH